jgi:primosomal protein N' (replication factor Y)
MFFIEVILPLALPKSFTYKVSEAEFHFLQAGMRVAVPFGTSKLFTGLVINKHNIAPQLYEAKEIHQILDQKPVVNSFQIEHWQWVASYYMCNLGDVFRSAMPSAFLMESDTIISLNKETTVQDSELTDNEFLVYQALQLQSTLKIKDVAAIIDRKNVLPLVYEMLHKNIIYLNEELQETYKPKLVRYIKLNDNYNSGEALKELLDNLKGAKQKELVLTYFQLTAQEKKPVSAKQLLLQSQATTATLKKMIEKEIFEECNIQEDRVNFQKNQTDAAFNLSQSQQNAFQEIKNQWIDKEVCLLHGVTASGKTEIYIKLIEEHINQQKQVLYLLPEIALTTQLVSRLTKYFGNKVAVFHSKYSNNERVEVWNNVLHNSPDAQIVIGARSALFLPFSNLGLLIIDEEHEASFKQNEPAPRYHTRDSAIVLAHSHQAKVLLGSATPSIETYYNTQIEKFGLVTLTERFNKTALPEVILVDLKDKYFRKKMTGHFSDTLLESIADSTFFGRASYFISEQKGVFAHCGVLCRVGTCRSASIAM